MAIYNIYNKVRYNIGFRRPGGLEVNLAPGKFISLTDDDIYYEATCMTNWLKDGVLWCPNDELYNLLNISRDKALVAQDDKDIIGKFKLNAKQFGAWLDELDSAAVLQKVFEVACGYDNLPMNKLEAIEKKTGKSISIARKQRDEK